MNASHALDVSFRETQRFTQTWLWLVIALIVAMGWWAFIQQIFLGCPFGNRPASDPVVFVVWALCGFGLPLLLMSCRLITEVRGDGLHVRFLPFHVRWRSFAFDQISSCEARTYHPVLEYGGWGIRCGLHGSAYNVRGNRGVQLTFSNGKRLLIGSQLAEELALAIKSGMDRVGRRRG